MKKEYWYFAATFVGGMIIGCYVNRKVLNKKAEPISAATGNVQPKYGVINVDLK